MRNGPNSQFKPDDRYAYPFDGTGMIHAIYIENGRARYRNRWVLTKEVLEERAAGHRIYNSSFSAPPHADLNTNIVYHAGRYLALYEGGVPYELNRGIDTVGLRDPRPGEATQAGAFEAIARYDLTTGKKVVHQFPAAVTVCEPVFVADSRGRGEEDGFIFTFAHDAGSASGRFIILDARHLAGAPLAVVRLPRRAPAGLHGSWIPA